MLNRFSSISSYPKLQFLFLLYIQYLFFISLFYYHI